MTDAAKPANRTAIRPPDHGAGISHRDIAHELRLRILTARYKPGQRIPPERELLEEFGCSRLTVARAMAPLAAEGLVERHRGRGTFVAHSLDTPADPRPRGRASRLPPSRGNVVKYLSPGHDPSVRSSRDDVLAALHAALDRAGYHVSVDFYADLEQHLLCLDRLHDPQIAGVVLWPAPAPRTVAAVARLIQEAVPLVLIDTYLPELDSDFVVTDNIEGASIMVKHLASLGHRRIAYLTPPPARTSLRDRLTGFLRGMVESDLPLHPGAVVRLESGTDDPAFPGHLAQALDRLLAGTDRPTALFASNDSIALLLMSLLAQRGLGIPSDLSLAGFDGIEIGGLGPVPLTTVEQDFRQMADVAARVLLERFEGRTPSLRYHRLLRPRLAVRASSGPPPRAAEAAMGTKGTARPGGTMT